MAYNTKEMEAQAVDAIKKHKLVFIEDVVCYLPCSKETFYQHRLHESDLIKESIQENKTFMKQGLRSKWYNGNNPLTQMALYKLIGTEDEYHRIANTKTDNKTELSGGLDIIIKRE